MWQPVIVAAGAALALAPLALLPGVFISHDVIPKVLILTVTAAAILVLMEKWAGSLPLLWSQPAGRAFLVLLLAQVASLAVSTLFSSQIPLSVGGTVWRRFGLLGQTATLVIAVAIVALAASTAAWFRILFRSIAIAGGLAAAYGVLQYFNFDPFLERRLYAIDYFGGIARPPSTMGHALYFSAYLVPVLFIAVASAIDEIDRRWKRIHAIVAVLTAAAIVLSATRSAMLAAIAGGVYFVWRTMGSRLRDGQTQKLRVKLFAIPAAAAVAILLFALSPAGANLLGRVRQWRSDPGGPRLQMWKECPGLIALHPLFGEGPEVFAGEFRKVQSADLSRQYPDFYNETPHNALLDAACAQGIPGALILIGVFALPWLRRENRAFSADPITSGLNAAMLGIFVSSMFASLTLVTSLYLWTVAGLSVAWNVGSAKAKDRVATSALMGRVVRVATIVLGAVILAGGVMLGLEDAAWARLGAAVEARNFPAAREAYNRAISVGFRMPGYELWGSRELSLLGKTLGDSGNQVESASAWKMAGASAAIAEADGEERSSAAYQASVLAVASSDVTRAEAEAREAIRLAPNWYKGHLLLSQILGFMGRNEEAGREAEVSAKLGWRK